MEKTKRNKIIIVMICLVFVMSLIMFATELSAQAKPYFNSIRKSCDFVDVEDVLYAYCDDGSEYRIADQASSK